MSDSPKRLTMRWSERPPAVRSDFSWPQPVHLDRRSLPVAVAHLALVRSMRLSFIASLLLVSVLTSCITRVDGAWVSGRVHDVTAADIRAAVSASRAAPKQRLGGRMPPVPASQRPRQIDVVGQ